LPALPHVNAIRVNLPYTILGGVGALNRFFIQYAATAPSSADLNTFCTAVGTAWNTRFAALASSNVTLQPVAAIDLSSATGAIGIGTGTHAGANGHGLPTSGTAAVSQLHIARHYRGGKPKIFWPVGTLFEMTDPDTWTGAFLSSMQTAVINFFADVTALTLGTSGALHHVSVSYYNGFTVVTNPVTGRARNVPTLRSTPLVDPVLSYSVRSQIGTQRRRNGA
jgi:hypothetical protein